MRIVLDRSDSEQVDIRSQEEIDKREQALFRVSPCEVPEIREKTAIRSLHLNGLKDIG